MVFFIDFEASGLDRIDSYPIEVGWSDETGDGMGCLIKPSSNWTHWSEESEKIHGITQIDLVKNGMEPLMVACILNQTFKEETVYCDGRQYDLFWMMRLYDEAKITPSFRLGDYAKFIQTTILELPISMTKKQRKWKAFVGEYYAGKNKTAHRALADAKQLAAYYKTHC